MACNSCASNERFRAVYCDECESWTFHVDKHDLLIAAGFMAVAAVVIFQPEILAAAGFVLARRVVGVLT